MGACFYRLRCEVFQNLFLSPMNTGFVRPAVATVLTACGIETIRRSISLSARKGMLQQYLPLAVLKHVRIDIILLVNIELLQQYLPLAVLKLLKCQHMPTFGRRVATVLTACGIETALPSKYSYRSVKVATVLTACGIETLIRR